MEIGKVPENVLKRAVFKQIRHRREEVILHPGVGEDCSAVAVGEDEALVFSTDPITGTDKGIGNLAVHITANDLAGNKADIWYLRQHPKVMNLPWIEKIRRADRDNTIDVYISEDHDDVLADGVWQQFFTEKPEVLTREEKRAWLDTMTGVALGSDAFFPFGDNIERAHKSGVSYIAQPGGSVRDDHVIGTCDKYNMAMAFTGIRLFHH